MDIQTVTIGEISYINCDLILTAAPIYSKGARTSRALVKNKKIPENMYVYARPNEKNELTQTDGRSKKVDKIFLNKDYIVNISELRQQKNGNGNGNGSNGAVDNNKEIREAPPIIELADNEKFTDNEGNVVEIETRGKRSYDSIYFKVKDVSTGFEIKRLSASLLCEDSGYESTLDYTYFVCKKYKSLVDNADKKRIRVTKELFLTYHGILRVLFVSRSGKANHFIKWATETLFTVQLGTEPKKCQLVSDLLGVSIQTVKEVLKTSPRSLPCVYLFSLGTVKNLRKSMNIDAKYRDNDIVCKYGYTIDLSRRMAENMKTYGSIDNVELKLKCYSYIDPTYCPKAETHIKDYFAAINCNLKYKDYSELVVIKTKLLTTTENQYKLVSEAYAGHIKDMRKRIEDLEKEIVLLKKHNELIAEQHKNELLIKTLEIEAEKHKNDILRKDFEIGKLTMGKN